MPRGLEEAHSSASHRDGRSRHQDPGGRSARGHLSADGHPESRGGRPRLPESVAPRAVDCRCSHHRSPGPAGDPRTAQSRLNPPVRPALGRRGQRLREPHHETARCRPSASRRESSVPDMLTQQTRGASVETLTALGLFFLAGAAFYGYLWFASAQWREFAAFVAIFSAGFAVIWFATLIAKLTGKVR